MRINLLKLFSVDNTPVQIHVYFSITRSNLSFFSVHLNKHKKSLPRNSGEKKIPAFKMSLKLTKVEQTRL